VDRNVADDEQFEGMDISQPYYLQRLEEVCWNHLGSEMGVELISNNTIVYVLHQAEI
jgi:hypothetical protein